MHQSVPYLSLLQDTEKLSLELLGRNGSLSNDYLRGFRGISHSAHIKFVGVLSAGFYAASISF